MTYGIESFINELDYECAMEEYEYVIEGSTMKNIVAAIDSMITKVLSYIAKLYAKIRKINKIYVYKDELKAIKNVQNDIASGNDVNFKEIEEARLEVNSDVAFNRFWMFTYTLVSISEVTNGLDEMNKKLKEYKSQLRNAGSNFDNNRQKLIKNQVHDYSKLITYYNKMIIRGITILNEKDVKIKS